jgi:hypothetical protein
MIYTSIFTSFNIPSLLILYKFLSSFSQLTYSLLFFPEYQKTFFNGKYKNIKCSDLDKSSFLTYIMENNLNSNKVLLKK